MKKNLVIFLTLLIACFFPVSAQAKKQSINGAVSASGINRGAVSVSVKNIKTGKPVYSLNSDKPFNPASTQKLITFAASLDTLGYDYEFVTSLYKNSNNDLYLKLSGDPYFSTYNLKQMMKTAKAKKVITPSNIYIDDYVMDSVEWGEGWQWDDELNPLMPKFSSYNIDNNLIPLVIVPAAKGAPADIHTEVFYPLSFINLVSSGVRTSSKFESSGTNIRLSKKSSISADMITVEGVVIERTTIYIPVNHPKRYFFLRLDDCIRDAKIQYYGSYKQMKLPSKNIYLIAETRHTLKSIADDILKNSNNYAAETVFKVAGGKFADNTGSMKNSLDMLNEYFKKNNLNADCVRFVDGSGVSKNNLMTADFMTDFLVKKSNSDDYEKYKKIMASPSQGTLSSRMLYFKDNMRAKTGTLADVSAIAGYITTQSGKTYAFDIMINDPKSSYSDKEMLEEYIIRAIYNNY